MKTTKTTKTILSVLSFVALYSVVCVEKSNAFDTVTVCPNSDVTCRVLYNGVQVTSEKGKNDSALEIKQS